MTRIRNTDTFPANSTTRYFKRLENGAGVFASAPTPARDGSGRAASRSPVRKKPSPEHGESDASPKRARTSRRRNRAQSKRPRQCRPSLLADNGLVDATSDLPDFENYKSEEEESQHTNHPQGTMHALDYPSNTDYDKPVDRGIDGTTHPQVEVRRPYSYESSLSDDGADRDISGYPGLGARSSHREIPQPGLPSTSLDPILNINSEDDYFYEADGEGGGSTDWGSNHAPTAPTVPLTSHGEGRRDGESKDEDPNDEHLEDNKFESKLLEDEDEERIQTNRSRQGYDQGRRDQREDGRDEIDWMRNQRDRDVAANQRATAQDIVRVRQEAIEAYNRGWYAGLDSGRLDMAMIRWQDGRRIGRAEGYAVGLGDEAENRQGIIDLTLQRQSERYQGELIVVREEARAEGLRQGMEDGHAEGLLEGQRAETVHYQDILDGLEVLHAEHRRAAYRRGYTDRGVETSAHLQYISAREPP